MAEGEKRLRCRALLHRLAAFGVIQARQRGSHIVLLKPTTPGGTKGATYPVACHDPNHEISVQVIRAILRKFEIPEDGFWATK